MNLCFSQVCVYKKRFTVHTTAWFCLHFQKAKTRLAQQKTYFINFFSPTTHAPLLEPHLRHGLNHRLLDYKADTLANAIIYILISLFLFTGGSPISLEFSTGVALPPPPTSPSPPPQSSSLTNFTVSWGSEDVKMISMELGPPPTSMGGGMTMHHDPSYSPHQESLGSDPGSHQEYNDDGMHGDSKRKRKFF